MHFNLPNKKPTVDSFRRKQPVKRSPAIEVEPPSSQLCRIPTPDEIAVIDYAVAEIGADKRDEFTRAVINGTRSGDRLRAMYEEANGVVSTESSFHGR